MRLLMEVGYTRFLFGEGAPIAEILAVADGIKVVEKDYSSGVLTIKDDARVSFELVPDDSVTLPDGRFDHDYEKFHELAASRDELRTEVAQLKRRLAEVQEAAKPEKENENVL